jgi:hypothetical protein
MIFNILHNEYIFASYGLKNFRLELSVRKHGKTCWNLKLGNVQLRVRAARVNALVSDFVYKINTPLDLAAFGFETARHFFDSRVENIAVLLF